MNKRIQELAEQCTTQYRDGHGGYLDVVDTEKFAELIVRECIDQCSYNAESNDEWDKGVRWAANQIKAHFDIES